MADKKDNVNDDAIARPSIQMGDLGEGGDMSAVKGKDVDVAATFLANLDPAIILEPISEKEKRKLLWKIDLTILPLLWVTTIVGAVDKVIISNAAIYGMREDTHLVGNDFNWVGSIFYFGYLTFEYPAAILIQRLPVAKFFALTVFGWAALLMCTAAAQNYGGLLACRFFMGMFESIIFPVATIITVMWWKNDEHPIRIACWFSQFSSIFSGIVSYGIGHTHSAVHPWRLLFIVLGAFSLLWAIVLWLCLPDTPLNCWYLSDREKYVAIERVKGNNTGVEDKKIKWYQVRECLMDPKTWLLAVFAVSQNIPNGGLITFAGIIVSGLGYTPLVTTLLGIPTGVVATVWGWIMAYPAGKFKNCRCWIIAVANLVTIVCAILMWKLPRSNKKGLLAAYYVFYTYWGPYVISTSLPLANTSGHSKKVTMNAIFFLSYCLGNILGPQVFRASDAPSYSHGYQGLLACLVLSIAAIAGYGILCWRENKQRDKAMSADGQVDEAEAFSDLTDKEKIIFRYTY
ncbi:hypothetical protein B7463_g6600, partial [Scytalidium lignicola]